ncbi:Acyl-CoA synthetase (AMP-forming)/AMP-acid ligase II [Selenomonas sp. WCT3]|uniref:AMP-binding protein n=1 Tax=Selenomonas sp. WCT3 TaxID=3158785 RepID=UPI000886D581|nr:Acyl-CoA synthetase (AMP-forming)/AMP-acid ligase II [Selenomonas ruminantium]
MMFNLSAYKGDVSLIDGEHCVTYEMLIHKSNAIAKAIGNRCLVFILCTNTPASIYGYVGTINNNIVPLLLDYKLDNSLLNELLNTYKPDYLWLPKSGRHHFSGMKCVFGDDGYELLKTCYEEPVSLYEDLALLMTTSGSTGSPKLVRLSYDNIRSNTESIVSYLNIDAGERAITSLPMHYVYGLSVINTHLYAGASLVVTEKTMFQREFWDMVKTQAVTSFSGVPYTYTMLEKLRFFRMNLPSLHTLTQAGGKLDPELHEKFARYAMERGKKFVVMYGAAEATARMGYLPAEYSLAKAGAMGIAIPGGRFELSDDNDNIIDLADTPGELIYYGPNVSLGYAENKEELANGDEQHGRLATGDIAQRDQDGFYTVVGRKKRFLKIFGKRINLAEVEHILRQHFKESEFACTGRDDYLFIFFVGGDMDEKIKSFLVEKIAIHPSALRVLSIPDLPKNAAGKTLYRELEQYYDL